MPLLILFVACLLPPPVLADDANGQKAVLITGASSGIGRHAAERLAKAGYYVYAGARSADDIAGLNAIDNVSAVSLDVGKPGEIGDRVIGVEPGSYSTQIGYSPPRALTPSALRSQVTRGSPCAPDR